MRRFVFIIVALFVFASPAFAVLPDEVLSDPALEARARALSQTLRCMVCQNQSIDDSDAPLARDLRILVRERLKAGDSDQQIREFLIARYGKFVLLQPEKDRSTFLLWATPLLVLLFGGLILLRFFRRPAAPAEIPLSDAEKQRLQGLSDLTKK
ncbi:MAG: cytochrome c-type biogenesis protein CcmH [Xanthobacteraceae bacterium]|nr:cytochrome c-type biogenesis protein CcmH [Pseudolabrys sp.]MCW5680563.1 cytochrome c-type biogenesis protein CcmH [Xanthobacteraceae bacterium]QYK45821.1 MAG: cytochrome c-type biogenesis protein CcmH [Xanthobacteraceae bacterium]